MRPSGREADQMRIVRFTPDFTKHAEGSVLAEFGATRVLCTASVENRVPPFLIDSGKWWATAEYAMLPRATPTRSRREVSRGRPSGRGTGCATEASTSGTIAAASCTGPITIPMADGRAAGSSTRVGATASLRYSQTTSA